MSIAFYPAIHWSRDIYAVGTQSIRLPGFWLGAIKPPRLKRTSASPICVFPLCVFPLTPSADRWSNILFAHDFTGTIVISSFPGAGPQCESSEKKEQLILKMLSFLTSTESDECFPKRV